ncbi:arginase family protein [Microbacterium sp. 18062]|uniref:arginase family protein n=1 Tax=Microbacterium sp. 18062 TaxID=2681410 RepID=UPI001358897F|nr:arginase family protein [Microbacterium sp. 18062]
MARFLIVPQWQGSSSARAMQLVDGAEAIAGDLPRAACTMIEVPAEAGEDLGTGVRRLSTLRRVRELVEEAVRHAEEPLIVVGGDCGVAAGAVAATAGDDLAVVWMDAHADLNSPESSLSGAFHGMVLRAILGEGPEGLALPAGAVTPARVVLVGTRDLDPAEAAFVEEAGIRMLPTDALDDPAQLVAAVAATGARRIHIHIDLDVLDPSAITGIGFPVPFGADPVALVAALRALREAFPVAGATITEFAPASPADAASDLGTILRLVGALA